MLRFFKRLFVPTRFDATCFVIAIHWVLAILSVLLLPAFAQSAGVHQADAVIVVAAATILAIAATIGWKVNSRRRMLALLSSSIASLGFVIGWCCFNADYLRAQTKTSVYRMPQSPFDADLFLGHTFWMLCWIIVVALIVLAGNWIVPRIFMAMKSPSSWLGRKFGDDRTRTLVFIAAGLFALAIAGRVLQSIGMGFDSNGVGSAFTLAMGLLGYSLLWAITLYWFPRSFVFNGKPVQKLVSFLLMLLVAVPVFANAIQNFAVTFEDVIQLVGGVVFVLSVIGVGGEQSEVAADSNQAADSHQAENEVVRKARVVSWPSLFSVAAVAMLAATLAMPWFIDLGILAMPYRSGVSSVRRLQLAVESARVRRDSGGKIKPYFDDMNQVVTWKVQFDEDSPADLLSAFQGYGGFNCIELSNLKSRFDLSEICGLGKAVKLTDCEVSHSQLSDILSSASWMEITGEFSLVDDGAVVDSGNFSSLGFRDTNPGAVAAFFGAAKCEKRMTIVIVNTPVGSEDWPAVEEVAQSGRVYLYGGWIDGFQLPKQTRPLSKVHYVDTAVKSGKVKVDKDLFLNTDIVFYNQRGLADSPEFAWKLLILRGSSDFASQVSAISTPQVTFAERAKNIGMAYQLNEDQTIRSLYIPWGNDVSLDALTNLKVLSFDPGWVGFGHVHGQANSTHLGHLKLLPKLEELYFDSVLVPEDLAFLASMNSLKHLQIPNVVRKVTGPIGFDACQSLESITFLGTPDNQTYREVALLQNLKRLVIVDFDEDEMLTPEYRDKLAKKLPGVEVEILKTSETESLVPDPFREYRDRVRKELREDTSWLDEILN